MPHCRFPLVAAVFLFSGSLAAPAADTGVPRNLGRGLRQLAQWQVAETAGLAAAARQAAVSRQLRATRARAQIDTGNRVVVDAYLDGSVPAGTVRGQLTALAGLILNHGPPRPSAAAPHGVFSLRLPVDRVAEAARVPGVQSVSLVRRPIRRVGRAHSQGAIVIKSDAANSAGYRGVGVTVGVLSDSYDAVAPHADADVRSGDLPGLENPNFPNPVVVLEDGDPSDRGLSDEGRALLQIVHDVAPGARLAFATVGPSQTTFAEAIEALRTDPGALCDVLVDDVGFPDEPFFSDGMVAQAAQEAATSTTLAGRPVCFYSAAGNHGSLGYEADFSPVADSLVRARKAGKNNLKFAKVAAELTAGGFHNFTPGAPTPTIVQRLEVEGDYTELLFQWNDLFDPAKMTADYHVLIFDRAGNYLPQLSGIDAAFETGQALQFAGLVPTASGKKVVYQVALARGAGGSGAATHFRYLADVEGTLNGTFLQTNVPTTFGHSVARGVDGVAAYAYDALELPEDFTSHGPARIDFDEQGNRLSVPEIRQQPTFAAPDGVDTSFFPVDDASFPGLENDTDGSGFPNFFGTSAAAPHVAGVAALLLAAAGGPGSKTPAEIRAALASTAAAHDLSPHHIDARLATPDGALHLTADGNESNFSAADRHFFSLRYTGTAGTSLRTLTIDLSPVGLKFDRSANLGFPFTVGTVTGGVSRSVRALLQRPAPAAGPAKLTLTFGKFPPGGTLTFGIDRDFADISAGGNSADLLAGATLSVTTRPAALRAPFNAAAGLFLNEVGEGYGAASGFGLINASAAINEILP